MKANLSKILSCMLFFICMCAYTNEAFSLKNHISVGMKNQTLTESVFKSSSKISELIWKSNIEPYIANELEFGAFGINFLFGFSTAIPVKTGFVEDCDWLLSDNGMLSNYSYHDNFIDKDYTLYFKASYSVPVIFKRLFISAGLGLIYSNEKYVAKNGYYKYSLNNKPVDSNTKKTDLCGTIMSYEMSGFIPLCFIDMKIKLNEKNSCFLNFDFFPYMLIDSIDTHIMRLVEFYDSMRGGCGFKTKTGHTYQISKRIALESAASYSILEIFGISGTRKMGENSAIEKDDGIRSGLRKSYVEIQIGFSYKMY